jgi:4-hydroxyphenylpyruvate dioxygenase
MCRRQGCRGDEADDDKAEAPMHKGIATVSGSGALSEKLAAIAAAKFDGVEIFDVDLIASPLRPVEVAAHCADLGLSVDLFQSFRDVGGNRPDVFPLVLHRLRRKLDVMEQLGTTTMPVCSNATPDALGDRDLAAEQAPRGRRPRFDLSDERIAGLRSHGVVYTA